MGWVIAAIVLLGPFAGPLPEARAVIAAQDQIDQPTTAGQGADATAAIEADAVGDDAAAGVFAQPSAWVLAITAVLLLAAFFALRAYRLDTAPKRPKALTPELGTTLFFGMFLLGVIVQYIVSKRAGITGESETLPHLVVLQGSYYAGQALIVGAFIAVCRTAKRPPREARPSVPWAIVLGAAAMALWWPIVQTTANLGAWIVQALWQRAPDPIGHETLRVFIDNDIDGWWWALVVCVTLVAGVFEEVMYRGILQETIRRMRVPGWIAIALTSVLFALVHMGSVPPHGLVALFVLSLGFGWAYEKTGRLAAPMAMHILFNAANVALAMGMVG
jgi:membrane protease YdiL (CAAX protease family)